MNFNHNVAECFVHTRGLLSKTITNVCDGSIHHVPYGWTDILFGWGVGSFLFLVLIWFIAMIVALTFM